MNTSEKTKRMGDLANMLDRSVTLEKHFPGCFDHGKCKTFVTGTAHHPLGLTFIVEMGNGERIEKNALDVPVEFWRGTINKIMNDTRQRVDVYAYRKLLKGK